MAAGRRRRASSPGSRPAKAWSTRIWHTYWAIEHVRAAAAPDMRAARQQHGEIRLCRDQPHPPAGRAGLHAAARPDRAWLGWRREPFADLGRARRHHDAGAARQCLRLRRAVNPHDRYGARLVWLAPLVVALRSAGSMRTERRNRRPAPIAVRWRPEPVPPAERASYFRRNGSATTVCSSVGPPCAPLSSRPLPPSWPALPRPSGSPPNASRAVRPPGRSPAASPVSQPARSDRQRRHPDRMGGQEPLPAVPPRGRFPAPCRGQHAPAASSPPSTCSSATPTAAAGRRAMVEPSLRRRRRRLLDTCERDGERENYLAPKTHLVVARLTGAVPRRRDLQLELRRRHHPAEAGQRALARRPVQQRARLRQADHRRGRHHPAGQQRRQRLDRNPGPRPADRGHGRFGRRRRRQSRPADRARRRRLLLPALPRRRARRIFPAEPAGLRGRQGLRRQSRAAPPTSAADWAKHGARWMSAACHRSLYGYQLRTALALAVENRQIAVTFLPLACSGATIDSGLLGSQGASECPPRGRCAGTVPAQIEQLQDALDKARKQNPEPRARPHPAHRRRQRHQVLRPRRRRHHQRRRRARAVQPGRPARDACRRRRRILDRELPGNFAKLRAALKPLVGGDLSRVVYRLLRPVRR